MSEPHISCTQAVSILYLVHALKCMKRYTSGLSYWYCKSGARNETVGTHTWWHMAQSINYKLVNMIFNLLLIHCPVKK